MVVTPTETPVMTPEEEPIVAMAGDSLLHTPPGTTFDNVRLLPTHTLMPIVPGTPIMGPGIELTVIVVVT